MWLFDFFKPRKQKTLLDKLEENPIIKESRELFDFIDSMCEDGCETDEIPRSYGEFGHEITNPIPTHTLFGSTKYLAHLRLPDGAKVDYEREGSSLVSSDSTKPIDIYRIMHPDGTEVATLYLCPYHKRNSEKVPEGFTL